MDKEKNENNSPEEEFPGRPVECGECKKPIAVCYTEIVGDLITRTSMCANCPELERRLCKTPKGGTELETEKATSGLACGNCGTSLKAVRLGAPLGCSICYEVFDDVLIGELFASEKIPKRVSIPKKTTSLHVGRTPGKIQEITPSIRLLALNEALTETLKKEDYEQAAKLRDQIKAITEKEVSHDNS